MNTLRKAEEMTTPQHKIADLWMYQSEWLTNSELTLLVSPRAGHRVFSKLWGELPGHAITSVEHTRTFTDPAWWGGSAIALKVSTAPGDQSAEDKTRKVTEVMPVVQRDTY